MQRREEGRGKGEAERWREGMEGGEKGTLLGINVKGQSIDHDSIFELLHWGNSQRLRQHSCSPWQGVRAPINNPPPVLLQAVIIKLIGEMLTRHDCRRELTGQKEISWSEEGIRVGSGAVNVIEIGTVMKAS